MSVSTGARRDSLRRALQTALAGALAYAAERHWGAGESFLAVISAALVIDDTSDQTLNQARARILATVLGTFSGIAVMAIFAGAPAWIPLSIVLAIMAAVSAYRSAWSYGIVAACALALGSEENRWEVAQDRGIAIAIGATIGMLVGFCVWPESAQSNVRRAVRTALEHCRDLLEYTVDTVASEGRRDPTELHRRFSVEMSRARNAAASISVGSKDGGENYRELVDRLDRLWHALIILDRIGEQQDGDQLSMLDETSDAVKELRKRAGSSLESIAQLEVVSDAARAELEQCLRHTRDAVKADLERTDDIGRDLEISALVFGLDETIGNLCEISDAIKHIQR